MVENTNISPGHARSLIGTQNSEMLAKEIVEKKLSVRQTEALVRKFKGNRLNIVRKKDANILNLEKSIEEKVGLNVSIVNKKNSSGTISFEYKDLEQLDKIINSIKNNY